jgi:hypothetical protein
VLRTANIQYWRPGSSRVRAGHVDELAGSPHCQIRNNAGQFVARPRLLRWCAVAASRSRKCALFIISPLLSSWHGSATSIGMVFPACGAPGIKSTGILTFGRVCRPTSRKLCTTAFSCAGPVGPVISQRSRSVLKAGWLSCIRNTPIICCNRHMSRR